MSTRASPAGRIASEFDLRKVVKLVDERDSLTESLVKLHNNFDGRAPFYAKQPLQGQTGDTIVELPPYLIAWLIEGLDKRIKEIRANLHGAYGLDDNAP